jgi:hypothetical protein
VCSSDLDEAREILDAVRERSRDRERVEALDAQLKLAAGGGGADTAALAAKSPPTATISTPACNWPMRWRWHGTIALPWSSCLKSSAATANGRTKPAARPC